MKNKILVSLLLIIMLGGVITNGVNATTSSFTANLISSTTSLEPGEEITISLKVSDINMGEDGINALEGTIKYDTNIFETIKQSNITSENGWSVTYNSETGNSLAGKFLAVNLSAGTKEDTQILTVKFKVKEDIDKTTTTQIDFEDVTSNDGIDLVNVGNKSVKITVNVDETPKNEISNEEIPKDNNEIVNDIDNIINEEIKNNVVVNTTNQNNTNDNRVTGTLPQTGTTPMMIIVISAIIIICVYMGIRYRNMRDIK